MRRKRPEITSVLFSYVGTDAQFDVVRVKYYLLNGKDSLVKEVEQVNIP